MNILDTKDVQIYSTSSTAINSTVSFTWIIPDNLAGGEYKIVIQGQYIADAIRVIRIREYEKEELIVQGVLAQDSYLAGELVQGVLKVKAA
jgi:hypothetical protein